MTHPDFTLNYNVTIGESEAKVREITDPYKKSNISFPSDGSSKIDICTKKELA